MLNLNEVLHSLSPELVEVLSRAVEQGRWDNGTQLTDEQKTFAIQAIIAYQAQNAPNNNEPFKVDDQGQLRLGKGRVYQDTKSISEPASRADILIVDETDKL